MFHKGIGRTTIDIIGLNRLGRLVSNRSNKWNECLLEILDYKNASDKHDHQALKLVQRASAVKNLKKMVKYEEEFSSVALSCIRKTAPESLYKQVIS